MPSDEIQFPISGRYLEKKQQVHDSDGRERRPSHGSYVFHTRPHTENKNKKHKKK